VLQGKCETWKCGQFSGVENVGNAAVCSQSGICKFLNVSGVILNSVPELSSTVRQRKALIANGFRTRQAQVVRDSRGVFCLLICMLCECSMLRLTVPANVQIPHRDQLHRFFHVLRHNNQWTYETLYTLHTYETMRCRRTDSAPIARHCMHIDQPVTTRYHPYRDITGITGTPHNEIVILAPY